jgi:hypothetical protein
MMKLVFSNKIKKKIFAQPSSQPYIKKNKYSTIHPVNHVLSDVVAKKPLKSCGCGK